MTAWEESASGLPRDGVAIARNDGVGRIRKWIATLVATPLARNDDSWTDSIKEIASSFASQKTRNDDSKACHA